jgi:hypothetical protein
MREAGLEAIDLVDGFVPPVALHAASIQRRRTRPVSLTSCFEATGRSGGADRFRVERSQKRVAVEEEGAKMCGERGQSAGEAWSVVA